MIRDFGIVEPGTTLYIPFHKFTFNGSNHVYCDVRSLVGTTSITDTDRFPGL
jgi:hypothetical protein